MRFKNAVVAMALAMALTAPVCAASAENVALAVGEADIFASVPLCTYWYAQDEYRGVTHKMVVTNYGPSPIIVSQVRLPDSIPKLAGVPCEIMPSMHTCHLHIKHGNGAIMAVLIDEALRVIQEHLLKNS